MGRQLQKKKNKSSTPKVKRRHNPHVHKVKSFGHPLIAKNWDKSQTLSQNYDRLGLSSKLNVSTWCQHVAPITNTDTSASPDITKSSASFLKPGEARIIRDVDGSVLRVEHAPTSYEALDLIDSGLLSEQRKTKTDLVRQLEELAKEGGAVKRESRIGSGEEDWISRLVKKYDDDYEKMARDRRMNVHQNTVGVLRRKCLAWQRKRQAA